MSEKLEGMKASAEKDEQRIRQLQERLKAKREKIRETENAEIMANLNLLSAKGLNVKGIIAAISQKDYDTLRNLLADPAAATQEGKTGTGSGFASIIKEEESNE